MLETTREAIALFQLILLRGALTAKKTSPVNAKTIATTIRMISAVLKYTEKIRNTLVMSSKSFTVKGVTRFIKRMQLATPIASHKVEINDSKKTFMGVNSAIDRVKKIIKAEKAYAYGAFTKNKRASMKECLDSDSITKTKIKDQTAKTAGESNNR